MTRMRHREQAAMRLAIAGLWAVLMLAPPAASAQGFRIEEASIADIHNAIRTKQTTCQAVVQAYIDRAHQRGAESRRYAAVSSA